MTKINKTLWLNLKQGQYFHIPTALSIPSGELLLVALPSKQQYVAAESIAKWEISQEVAHQHLKKDVQQTFSIVEHALSNFFTGFFIEWKPTFELQQPTASEEDILLKITGVSAEEVRQNPSLITNGIRALLGQTAILLNDIFCDDPNRLPHAEQKLNLFLQQVTEAGIQLDTEKLQTLPVKLQTWYLTAEDKEKFKQTVKALENFAVQPPNPDQDKFATLLGDLRIVLETLLPTEETVKDEAYYRDMARQSINETIGNKKFDFKKVWRDHQEKKANQN